MDSPNKKLERSNSKHEKRAGLQIQDTKASHATSMRYSFRGLDEYWTPRRYILTIFSVLCLFTLAGCFTFSNSMSRKRALSHESFVVSYNVTRPKLRHREPLGFSSSAGDALREQGTAMAPVGCNEKDALLRVYMYDLPPEFHYGMLVASPYPKRQIWPRNVSDIPAYPGGLYRQHSPEYWLTSDLLTSTMPERRSVCTAYRVDDWRFADVIFVPFFASLSYNKLSKVSSRAEKLKGFGAKDRELQEKLVKFLLRQPAWQASGGVDHVVVIHHPNSMQVMRDQLRNAMYVVADFGRYAPEVANLGKDIVAPYKHVVSDFPDDSTSFESRKTLLFFQGAIKRKEGGQIRQRLYELIKDEEGVYFEAGNTTSGAIHSATRGMQNSKFCLNLAGDTPSSNRLFDSIASHCVPVIISDEIELPFEDDLDYSEFCLFVKFSDALKSGFVINFLRGVSSEEWTRMWRRLQQVDRHFKYQHPTQPDDAVHMTWKAILRKVPKVSLFLNRERRYKSTSRKEQLKTSVIQSLFHW